MTGWLTRTAALAVAQFALGWLALQTAHPPSVQVPVWPPTGVALIALVVGGYRLWPGVFLGGFFTYLANARQFAPDLGWADTLAGVLALAAIGSAQAVAGAWLIRRRLGPVLTLHRPGEILYFLAVAGPVHCVVAASADAAVLCGFGVREWAEYGPIWFDLWWSDAVGGAVFGTLTLTAIGRPAGVWRPRRWTVGLPLLLAVGLMGVGFNAARQGDDRQAQERLADEAEQTAAALAAHLDAVESGLVGLRAGYRLDRALTDAAEWRRVQAAMGVYRATNSAVQSNGLVALVRDSDRERYEAAVRQEPGMAEFRLADFGPNGALLPAAHRGWHAVVRRVAPRLEGRPVIGVDALSDPDRQATVLRAEATGQPAATAPVRLYRLPEEPRAIVLFLPVKVPAVRMTGRERVVGFVAASLNRERLMVAAGRRSPGIEYALAHPATEPAPTAPAGGAAAAVALAFGGEGWEVRATAGPGFVAANRGRSARLFGVAGFGVVFLSAALLLTVTGQTGLVRAEVLARTTALEQEVQLREFTEQWLKGSEAQLAEAQRIARLGYWEWDPPADEVSGSDELARVLGRDRPNRQPLADFLTAFHPDDRRLFETAARATEPSGDQAEFEARVLLPDGDHRWAACTVAVSGHGIGVTVRGTVQDVADRKAAEERNQVHNLTARLLAESHSLDQAMPDVLAAVCRAPGWHVGEFWRPTPAGDTLRRAYHWAADGLAGFVAASAAREITPGEGAAGRTWATGRPQRLTDLTDPDRFCRPDEAAAHGLKSAVGFPVVAGGRTVGVLAFFSRRPQDVSAADIDMLRAVSGQLAGWVERAAAEERVRLSEARLAEAQRVARLGHWEYDPRTDTGRWSDQIYALFGFRPGEVPPALDAVADRIHPDDLPLVRAEADRSLRTGGPARYEFRVRLPSGEVRYLISEAVVELDPAGIPVRSHGVTQDVTDRRRAEEDRRRYAEALQQTQRMDSLGALAGGVAHDFNNLLTGILGNASLARELLPAGSDLHEFLRPVEQAAEQAAQLCQQMLAYSGRGGAAREVVDLNRLLADSTDLIRLAAGRRVGVRLEPAAGLPLFEADPGQLRQVVLNLVQNAAEATADLGEPVVVRTGTGGPPGRHHPLAGQTLSETGGTLSDAGGPAAPPDLPEVVWVEVEDRGCGMDDAVRGRMFEPFFTTKFAGRGLGLSAAHGIVRQHGGAIVVASEPGRGTVIRVYLPAAESVTLPLALVPAAAPAPPVGTAVLVADDEPMIRKLVGMAVRGLGYEAVEAEDGHQAVALVAADPGRFAVALLDVGMPGLDGPAALGELRLLRPDLPAVLMSGYTADSLTGLPADRVQFLTKPFQQTDLARCVQAAVGGSGG